MKKLKSFFLSLTIILVIPIFATLFTPRQEIVFSKDSDVDFDTKSISNVDSGEPTKVIDLTISDYKVDITTDDLFVVKNIDKKTFSLSNEKENFWTMSFQRLTNSPYGFLPKIESVRNKFEFNSSIFSLGKINNENISQSGIMIDYNLFDSSLNSSSDFLNDQIWKTMSYKQNGNKYGFSEGPESRQNLFNNSYGINTNYSALLISSKFNNETIKPVSNLLPITSNPEKGNGFYQLEDGTSWFSSGYFVNEKNSLSFYVPQRSQNESDFALETSITDDLKKMTAIDFFEANKDNLSSLLTLRIKNSLPVSISGSLKAEIYNSEGKIVFKYRPDKILSVEDIGGTKLLQKGFIDNQSEYTVAEISGFYTNTKTVGNTNAFEKPIGSIGNYVSAIGINTSQLKDRVLEIKDELWNECPDLTSKDLIIPEGSILKPTDNVADKTKMEFQVYPKYIYVNGNKIENDYVTPKCKIKITFTGFKKFDVTKIIPKKSYKENEYIPSELNYYFSDKIPGNLKDKLLNYCDITGDITDVSNVVINKVTIGKYDNTLGTAELVIDASNCRKEDQSKGSVLFNVTLTNLKTIKDTEVKTDGLVYSYKTNGEYTVEKFIYDLHNNVAYNDFYNWLKNDVIQNEPIDSKLTISIDNSSTWYSNKEKTLNININLDKYYKNNEIENNLVQPISILLENATSPKLPTSLSTDALWEYNDTYANNVTNDNIKDYLWSKINPTINSEQSLDNIVFFPRVDNSAKLLSKDDIKYEILNDDTKNIDGYIKIKYQLTTYYDSVNYNTIKVTDFDNTVIEEQLKTKDIDVTKYNDISNQQINVSGFEDVFASNFDDLSNQNLLSQLKSAINLSGNISDVNLTYELIVPQNNNDIYNGKLKIKIIIKNAAVYDDKSDSSNGYITRRDVIIDNVTLVGFKKYSQTELIKNSASIKEISINDDTTANNIDWTEDKLISLIYKNKKEFFSNLPIDFSRENILVSNIKYNAFDSGNKPIDKPTITFDVSLSKYLDLSGDSVNVVETTKAFGMITITDFRKSIATTFDINKNSGNENIISQKIDEKNFAEYVRPETLVVNIQNTPINYDLSKNISFVPKVDGWNNKEGTLSGKLTIKNIYVEDKNKQFLKGNISLEDVTISGFKKIQPTKLISNSLQIDASAYYASEIDINTLKELIFKNISDLVESLDNTFHQENIIDFNESAITRVNNDNKEGKIIIKANCFKINNYYANDEKYTWYKSVPGNILTLSDSDITITGFKQKLPTDITKSEIEIRELSKYIAQEVTSNGDEINAIIKKYIFDNKDTIFSNLLSIDESKLETEIVSDSWNNKEGSISINVKLFKYINDFGNDIDNKSQPKIFNVKIIGFNKVLSPTSLINNEIKSNLSTYADNTSDDDIKNYIIQNQKEIFNNIPINFIGENGYTNNDVKISKISGSEDLVQGTIKINIEISKYYVNDNKYSYIDASSSGNKLTLETTFFVNNYKPTVIPITDLSNIKLDSSLTINNQPISNLLSQDFISLEDKSAVTNEIKSEIVKIFGKQIIGITVEDIEITYTSSFNNLNGSIEISSIIIKNNKWIDKNGKRLPEYTITKTNMNDLPINVSGFKTIGLTSIITSNFKSTNMNGFDNSNYEELYPQEIVSTKIDDLTSEFKTWLQANLNNWITNIMSESKLSNKNFSFANEIFTKFEYTSYSNKNNVIKFNYEIDKKYVFSGDNGAYGVKNIAGTFELNIGLKVPSISYVNNEVNISSSELWGEIPSQFKDKNSNDFSNQIKKLIVDKLINERNQNPDEFIVKNSFFTCLPKQWKTMTPKQINDAITIEFNSLDDQNGSMTFTVQLSNVPFFIEKDGDYELISSYSTSIDNSYSIVVKGFKKDESFPYIPIILTSIGVFIVVVIIVLSLYYFHKKRKYKTVAIANKKD